MKTIFFLLLMLNVASIAASATKEVTINRASIFALRDALKLLNSTPHLVSAATAELCVVRTASEVHSAEIERVGPHANVAVNYYVSPGGVVPMKSLDQNFPTGTIILKEKLSPQDGTVAAVGGMVKRARGFDQKNGDWEYFYAAKSGGFEIGHISNCVGCHAKARSRDYVFNRTRFAQ